MEVRPLVWSRGRGDSEFRVLRMSGRMPRVSRSVTRIRVGRIIMVLRGLVGELGFWEGWKLGKL
jgi:hypothetical protein